MLACLGVNAVKWCTVGVWQKIRGLHQWAALLLSENDQGFDLIWKNELSLIPSHSIAPWNVGTLTSIRRNQGKCATTKPQGISSPNSVLRVKWGSRWLQSLLYLTPMLLGQCLPSAACFLLDQNSVTECDKKLEVHTGDAGLCKGLVLPPLLIKAVWFNLKCLSIGLSTQRSLQGIGGCGGDLGSLQCRVDPVLCKAGVASQGMGLELDHLWGPSQPKAILQFKWETKGIKHL